MLVAQRTPEDGVIYVSEQPETDIDTGVHPCYAGEVVQYSLAEHWSWKQLGFGEL